MKSKMKLYIALSSFLLSISCLGVSTFAWYNLGRQVAIDTLDISIDGNEKIMVGLKAPEQLITKLKNKYADRSWDSDICYFDKLNDNVLKDFSLINANNSLSPVSACYENKWLKYDDNNKIDVNKTTKPTFRYVPDKSHIHGDLALDSENQSAYMQFELYFKSTSDCYVFFNKDTTINANDEKNIDLVNSNRTLDDLRTVEKVIRMSTYSISDSYNAYKIYEPNPSYDENGNYIKTTYANRMNISPYDRYFDYDVNTNKEILYGEYYNEDKIVYHEDARVTGVEIPLKNGSYLIGNTNKGVEPIDIAKSLKNGLIIGEEHETIKKEDISSSDYQDVLENSLMYCRKGIPSKMILSIWAEGWDVDCTNIISEAYVNINVKFDTQAPIHFRP